MGAPITEAQARAERAALVEKEVRVFGPPGTGKTTWLTGSIRRTAASRQTSRITVASFTRTAAAEIAGRGLPLDASQVGTLHSLAYRAIGRPTVAEEVVDDWNRAHPALALTKSTPGRLDEASPLEFSGSTEGDALMSEVEALRARMRPEETWPLRARNFNRRWSEFKRHEGVVDFTDMIEQALETESAPGDPLVGFFDEVQDFTPLELSLIRHWGSRMERVILAGDDDQCIYAFKGATPDAFLDPPIPDDRKYVLRQSYRIPAAVHRVAERWIQRLTRREEKEYLPRDEEGVVRRMDLRFEDAGPIVRELAKRADDGKTVMLLGTCSYMLDRVKHELKAQGVPFHNPYRATRSDWNPLRPSRGVASAERLLAYLVIDERMFGELSRLWTGEDVRRWAAVVRKQGIFRRGAAGAIAGLPDRELRYEEVAALFESDDDLDRAVQPDLDWLSQNLLASSRPGMEYPIRVARRRGAMALLKPPMVCLGTIHSVKGGQADSVFVLPDLSLAGAREWHQGGESRDSIVRQMYVAMTRAKQELVICSNSGQFTVDPERLYRG